LKKLVPLFREEGIPKINWDWVKEVAEHRNAKFFFIEIVKQASHIIWENENTFSKYAWWTEELKEFVE